MGGVLSPHIRGVSVRVRFWRYSRRSKILKPRLAVLTRAGSTWCLKLGRTASRPSLEWKELPTTLLDFADVYANRMFLRSRYIRVEVFLSVLTVAPRLERISVSIYYPFVAGASRIPPFATGV